MIECMKSMGSTEIDHELIFYNLYLKKYLIEDVDIIPVDVNDNEFLLELMYIHKKPSVNSNSFSDGMKNAFAFYVSNGIILDKELNSDRMEDLRVYINVEKLRNFELNSNDKNNKAKVLKRETK